jgi:carbon monoxide dehydrogenase subunit G
MNISGENVIAADQQTVWTGLNDTEILRQSIPGCEEFEEIGDNEYKAVIVTRIGPVKAKFNGTVQLGDFDPPNGYTLSGAGSAGSMGYAKANARVTLSPAEGGTRLKYDVDAEMTGKIAQLGSRLIESTAGVLAGQFFKRFGTLVAETPEGAPAAAAGSSTKWIIIGAGALVAAAAAIYFLMT